MVDYNIIVSHSIPARVFYLTPVTVHRTGMEKSVRSAFRAAKCEPSRMTGQ